MKEITKGEFYVSDIKQDDGEYIYSRNNQFSAIARVYKGDNIHSEYSEGNSELFADAGTTANKCGLLPSELLKQRDELLEALKGITDKYFFNLSKAALKNIELDDEYAKAKSAIENATKK